MAVRRRRLVSDDWSVLFIFFLWMADLIDDHASKPLNFSSKLASTGDYSTESTLLFVNSVLKFPVSVLEPSFGTNGALIFFYRIDWKFIFANQGWLIISFPPPWPSLFFGSLLNSLLKRSCNSLLN